MRALAVLFFILSYLLAVADGALQDKGNWPSSPGRTGLRLYAHLHPWIVAGAVCGVIGVMLST
jgi:hypothetical protein